jgi:uncharacterized protein
MGLVFADSSALVKRHIAEQGSMWVRTWIAAGQGNTIIIAELAITEVLSALSRRRRQARLSARSFARLREDFLVVVENEYAIIPMTSALLSVASDLVVRYPLRALDAIHLAAALDARRRIGSIPLLVSADQQLLIAATAEGFSIDNPNNH